MVATRLPRTPSKLLPQDRVERLDQRIDPRDTAAWSQTCAASVKPAKCDISIEAGVDKSWLGGDCARRPVGAMGDAASRSRHRRVDTVARRVRLRWAVRSATALDPSIYPKSH